MDFLKKQCVIILQSLNKVNGMRFSRDILNPNIFNLPAKWAKSGYGLQLFWEPADQAYLYSLIHPYIQGWPYLFWGPRQRFTWEACPTKKIDDHLTSSVRQVI